jgi:hypothetical protein
MTENQSTALMAPRFIVGRPKAANTAMAGSKGSSKASLGRGLRTEITSRPAMTAIGRVTCRALICLRQAYRAQAANGQAGHANQKPFFSRYASDSRDGRPS